MQRVAGCRPLQMAQTCSKRHSPELLHSAPLKKWHLSLWPMPDPLLRSNREVDSTGDRAIMDDDETALPPDRWGARKGDESSPAVPDFSGQALA